MNFILQQFFRSLAGLMTTFNLLLVGCAHGELDLIFQQAERSKHKVDAIICAGDFQVGSVLIFATHYGPECSQRSRYGLYVSAREVSIDELFLQVLFGREGRSSAHDLYWR